MTDRCPNCGGLVRADAEWCGQCFTRLDVARPEVPRADVGGPADDDGDSARPPPAAKAASRGPAGDRAVRSTAEGIVWDCPTCGEVNPIESSSCAVCGTGFARLFERPEEGPAIDPGRAAALSLLFPGAGHVAAGRRADGVARAVVFTFALATGLLTLFAARAGNPLFLIVMVLSLGAAAALYVLSTLDAGRAAQHLSPIVSTRMLLYGAVGLMLMTLLLLTIATTQAAPAPRA